MTAEKSPRLPKGQHLTQNWPVLHEGSVPEVDLGVWTLRVFGMVERELEISWADFMELPQETHTSDIHCVTTWSRYDNRWRGVPFRVVEHLARPLPGARYVMAHAENGFCTNIPLKELQRPNVLLAHEHDERPLSPEHGYPLRLVVPHLYFWKSAKWLRALEFMAQDRPGFWEERGYHMIGDPWVESLRNPDGQRFRDDPSWFGDESDAARESWFSETKKERGRP